MKYLLSLAALLLVLVSGCVGLEISDEEYCNSRSISIAGCEDDNKCKLGGSCPVCADIGCHAKDYDKYWE